jgi:hypothetical protein|nr:MAG: hypothetical protein [Bacteriophage sp.]DAG92788.1 MAG TPA: hypothetical protein [Crassvirales sp.]
MKTFKGNAKLSFGLGAVNVAKRNAVSEPELVVNPTVGGFRITPAVSRALGLTNGGYIMFVSNIDAIEQAIANKDENLVAFCAEENIDMNTPEGVKAIHEAFDEWGIAKGIQMFDKNGNAVKTKERMSKTDKVEYVTNNFDDVLKAAIENGEPEFAASLQVEGITKEEQIEILANAVNPEQVNKYYGSKCSNSSNLSGTGVSLTFSDSAVWGALKEDLGEEAKKMSRTFEVDIKELREVPYFNGHKEVIVKAAMLGEFKDTESTRKSKGEDDAATDEVAE